MKAPFFVFALILSLGILKPSSTDAAPRKPHILMVIVDDLGWGNTGFHREVPTPEVVTPHMDSLVKDGIMLERHYVHRMCTPTRTSFQTGRLPAHVLTKLTSPCQADGGIPYNMTAIPAKMNQGGYKTHLVGKWDAGMTTPRHTPHGRGYDTALSYFSHGNWAWSESAWGGSEVNKTVLPCTDNSCVKDLWDTDRPASSLNGTVYEELLFRDRIQSILGQHDPDQPLFLVYTPKIAHYPLQAPVEYQEKFSFIDVPFRQVYHAMLNFLDDQLANITQSFKDKGMWDDTLMIFTADNGGYVLAEQGGCDMNTSHGIACFNGEAGANNYPLRGGKYTEFEGGIRGNAFISGGYVPPTVRGTTSSALMHIADWYTTFCSFAGVDPEDPIAAKAGLPPVDGYNLWPVISGQNATSPREDIIVDKGVYIFNQWKILVGDFPGATWSGPQYPNKTTVNDPVFNTKIHCDPCLFDLDADPTEHHDLAASRPDVVSMLLEKLSAAEKTIWDRQIAPEDPACLETAYSRYGGFLGPWKDLSDAEVSPAGV